MKPLSSSLAPSAHNAVLITFSLILASSTEHASGDPVDATSLAQTSALLVKVPPLAKTRNPRVGRLHDNDLDARVRVSWCYRLCRLGCRRGYVRESTANG